MTLTTLDPNSALVLIDLQKGIVARDTKPYASGEVVARAAHLAAEFRARGLPVVLVHVTATPPGRREQQIGGAPSPDWAEFVPDLGRQPKDHVVTKQNTGAFTRTGLEEWLRGKGVTQVVVGGIATSVGVEMTARQAYDAGFNVALAVDAMTDLSAETHENSVTRIFPRLGETGTVEEILSLLPQG